MCCDAPDASRVRIISGITSQLHPMVDGEGTLVFSFVQAALLAQQFDGGGGPAVLHPAEVRRRVWFYRRRVSPSYVRLDTQVSEKVCSRFRPISSRLICDPTVAQGVVWRRSAVRFG